MTEDLLIDNDDTASENLVLHLLIPNLKKNVTSYRVLSLPGPTDDHPRNSKISQINPPNFESHNTTL